MRSFVTFSLLFLLIVPAAAQEKYLRDVPEGHYAYDAVNDLVRRGVTGGFPDGTYRGQKNMSRFEIAAFISKFSQSFSRQRGANEKLVAELRSELALIQADADRRKKATRVAADLLGQWRAARAAARRGGRADYRLKTAITRNFSDLASFRLDLDTMDAGYDNGDRDLARDLLDFAGEVKLGPGALRVTEGPGDVPHKDDGLFPGEEGVNYRRPRRSAAYGGRVGRTDFALMHQTRSTAPDGVLGLEEVSLELGQRFDYGRAAVMPRTFRSNGTQRDNRLDLTAEFQPFPELAGTVLLGVGKTADYPHGLYLRGEIGYRGLLTLVAQKIGARYRENVSYDIFDVFDRALPDGATNFGLAMGFGAEWFARAQGDWTTPGDALTTAWRLGRNLDDHYALQLVYQTYNSTAVSFSQAVGLEANIKI